MRTSLIALVLVASSFFLCNCRGGKQIAAPADVAQPPATATTTASGLVYTVLKQGNGSVPTRSDKVTVHYTGWTVDGNMFDSSVARGRPSSFDVTGVIAGWTEALQLMKAGSSYRLWVPEHLAYRGQSGYPAGTLVFDVSLISVD